MANKKFYYHNKNNASKQAQNNVSNETAEVKAVTYDIEKLNLTLSALGISDTTAALLEKFNIKTASDIVRRTDKDMYKVQGLNKKILFEIKDAVRKHGMELKAEAPKLIQNAQKQGAENQQKAVSANGANDRRNNPNQQNGGNRKFNGADIQRNGQNTPKNGRQKQNGTKPASEAEKPQKLTAPLPVEQWRKIQKGGKWGFNDGFKTVIPAMYDEIFCFKDGLASVEIDEKCGYIDSENNIAVPLDYETAMSFSEGFASVVKGGKCGYINKNNEVVIPFEYDAATPFEEGEAKIKKDGRWGTITPDGSVKWI